MRLETQGHYKTHCEWYKSHPAYEIFYCSPPGSRLEQKTRLIASKASYAGEKKQKKANELHEISMHYTRLYVNDGIDIFELNDHQALLFLSTQIKT